MDKTKYEKFFSRDFTLTMLEVWYRGEAYDPKPWCNQRQKFLPYIVFERSNGTVTSHYNPQGVKWIRNLVLKSAKENKDFLNLLEKEVRLGLRKIQSIYEKELALKKPKLLKFINDFQAVYPWVEAMWWLCEMSQKELDDLDISIIKRLRESTNKLSAGTDIVVRKSLEMIFPKIKDYIHVLKISEIESELTPDINELKKRDKGFFYTDNQLFVDINKEKFENKYNILLEEIELEKELKIIKGQVANPGIVKGVIRKVMGHKEIPLFKKGEILVSPMTMPDFLPAMKKALAIITDEGGITCHAAIISRELGIPCIIGTKIATQVLKDGDLVEVDADKGVVRILK